MAKLDNIDQLVIETVFHDRGAVQGLSKIQNQQQQVIKKNKEIKQTGFALGKAFRLIGTYLGVREIAKYSDEWTNIKSTLSLVTKSEKERLKVQKELFDLSSKTRQDMSSTVDLYRRITTSTEQLGLSESKRLQIVEAINKALIVGGGTTAGNQAALVQLGQGLASGQLRGEELNSILEQSPRLAQMIAEGMGLKTGQLREVAKKGELTPEKVLGAISSQLKVIDEEFKKMKPTISQAFVVFNNSLGQLINNINEVTGFSTGLSNLIIKISENIKTFSKILLGLFLIRIKFVRMALTNTSLATRYFEMRLKRLSLALKGGALSAKTMTLAFIKLELAIQAIEEFIKFFKGEKNIVVYVGAFFMLLEKLLKDLIAFFVNSLKQAYIDSVEAFRLLKEALLSIIAKMISDISNAVETAIYNLIKDLELFFSKLTSGMFGDYVKKGLNYFKAQTPQNNSNSSSNTNVTYNNNITVNEASQGTNYVNNILEGQTRLAIDGLGY
jgi:tape measure domain-containing protein